MKKSLLLLFIFCVNIVNAQWSNQTSGTTQSLFSIQFLNSNLGYCSAENGSLRKTTNGGNTWTQVNANISGTKIQFITPDTGFAYYGANVMKTINGGVSWMSKLILPEGILALHFPTLNTGYCATWNSSDDSLEVYKSFDAGENWNFVGKAAFGDAYAIYFIDAQTGFLSNMIGDLYRTSDGGITWIPVHSSMSGVMSMSFPTPTTGYAVTELGNILKTTNGGTSWTETNPGFGAVLYSIDCTSTSNCYAVGGNGFSSGILIKTINGGTTWTQSGTTTTTFLSVDFINDTTGWTSGMNGAIKKYGTSGSVGIEEIENNIWSLYPNPASEEIYLNINSGIIGKVEIMDSFGKIILTQEIQNNTGIINIGSLSSGVYFLRITNAGNSKIKIFTKS